MEHRLSQEPVDYPAALTFMEARVDSIVAGQADECLWFLEHPPLYTAGTSAADADLLARDLPVYETGRGGQYTYHGPGQRVVYVMTDLKRRYGAPDLRRYVCDLEEWVIRALARLGVRGERRDGRIGIWVVKPDGSEAKIAALGIRVRRWVAYHGISVNVNPDLSRFAGIVPCGIRDHGVTSLADLGGAHSMQDLDAALEVAWADVFDRGAPACQGVE